MGTSSAVLGVGGGGEGRFACRSKDMVVERCCVCVGVCLRCGMEHVRFVGTYQAETAADSDTPTAVLSLGQCGTFTRVFFLRWVR